MFAHPAKAPKAKAASQSDPAHATGKSLQQRAAQPRQGSAVRTLANQRTGGNQATLRLLEKKQGLSESTSATMLEKLAEPATMAPAEVPAVARDVLSSPGEQLDAVTRAYFEPRFGFDFSA